MILLSLLVILTLGIRCWVWSLPPREPAGVDQFQEEAVAILAALVEADSLSRKSQAPPAQYPSTSPRVHSGQKALLARGNFPVNLNEADSAALLPLPGIGPVYASRILKYRELLGGFVNSEQLLEVYGLERGTLDLITSLIYVDSVFVRKLAVNSAAFRELLRHPYLEYEDVKALVNYRDIDGSISSVSEIWEHGLLADSTLERIAPYLEFSD